MSASARRLVVDLWVVAGILLGLAAPAVGMNTAPAAAPGAMPAAGATGTAAPKPPGPAYVALDVSGPETVGEKTRETVRLRVVNLGPGTLRNARLVLEPAAQAEWVGRTTYPLPDLGLQEAYEVEAVLRARGAPGERASLQVRVAGGNLAEEETATYSAVVRQDVADVWEAAGGATTWEVEGRTLVIELPLTRDASLARLSHRALFGHERDDPAVRRRFELRAYDAAGQELATLQPPLRVHWRYGAGLPAAAVDRLRLAWLNPVTQAWEQAPTSVDRAAGTLDAALSRSGVYAVLADPPQYMAPHNPLSGLEPDLYTGAAVYRLALPLFTRPGGFAPELALSYNSRMRDVNQNFGSSGSLVGWGWELQGLGAITSEGDPGDRVYTLFFGGNTYHLEKMAQLQDRWYAREAPWRFDIVHKEKALNAPDFEEEKTWDVWTQDGDHYEFTGEAERWVCDGTLLKRFYMQWFVTRITAAADDGVDSYSMDVTYAVNTRHSENHAFGCGVTVVDHVNAAWPTQISYQGVAPSSPLVIDLVYGSGRSDRPGGPGEALGCDDLNCSNHAFAYYQVAKLEDIVLRAGAGGTVVRRYHLDNRIADTGVPANQQRLFLYGIEVSGAEAAGSVQALAAATPYSATFTYTSAPGIDWSGYGVSRLETISDRQGATATLTYEPVGSSVPASFDRLKTLRTEDGLGNVARETLYDYHEPNDVGGHGIVQVQDVGYGWRSRQEFYALAGEGGKRGLRKMWVRYQPDAAWVEQVNEDYKAPALPAGSTIDPWVIVNLPAQTERILWEGASFQAVSSARYDYTLAGQDQVQAGNLTFMEESAGGVVMRTTVRTYHPSQVDVASSHVSNRLAEEKVWRGKSDGTGVCESHQRLYYDQNALNQPPVKGLLTRAEAARSACDTDFVSQVENRYEPGWNNLQRTQNALGWGTDFGYDGVYHSFVVTSTNALAQTTTTVYDNPDDPADEMEKAFGLPWQVLEPSGVGAPTAVYTATYDVYGRLLSRDRPLGANPDEVWEYHDYDGARGQPQFILHRQADGVTAPAPQDGTLNSWTYYDGLGRVVQTQGERDDAGTQTVVASRRYDGQGRLAQESVPYEAAAAPGAGYRPPDWGALAGQSTSYAYDGLDRPTLTTHPDGSTVQSSYNYLQTAVIDENGHQTISVADALGRTTGVRQYDGEYPTGPGWSDPVYGEASYTYDAHDRLLTATGPDPDGSGVQVGATTTVTYNLLGWKTGLSDPDMGAWSYGYDDAGNLVQQTDAVRRRTCLYYDALNRLQGKTYTTDAAACPSDPGYGNYAVAHHYDDTTNGNHGLGRRTSMVDGSGSTAWVYDERGRVAKETRTIGGEVYATAYDYDASDRVTWMQYPVDNEIVTTTYNAQGLPATLAGTAPYVQSASYDAAGRPRVRILGSNLISTEAVYYDWSAANGRGRLQQLRGSLVTPPTPLQDLTYTYDAAGNVSSIVDAANNGQRQCFRYDALNRLKSGFTGDAVCDKYVGDVGAAPYNETYEYKADGNLDSKTGVGSYLYDAPVMTCSPGTQPTKPHAVRQAGSSGFSYDCNGNMSARVVANTGYSLFYNAENRLETVEQVPGGGVNAVYVYDGDGRRVQATTNGETTHYPGPHFERTLSSGYTKYYSFGGELVAFERSPGYPANTGRRFVLRDHLNSTSVIVNGGGTKLWEERYLPFGELRQTWKSASEMPVQTPYRYTGQRLEVGVGAPSPVGGLDRGLYDYGARWYDPMLGRFAQPDSIVPNPGNPQSLNRYAYVLNNPLRYTDPTGMFSEEEIKKYLGAKTWDDVLAMFKKGGQLEGAWGYLEVLREAELGDTLNIWLDHTSHGFNSYLADWSGRFTEKGGKLMIATDAGAVVAGTAPAGILQSYANPIMRLGDREGQKYIFNSVYTHVVFRPQNIDWTAVGLDAVGASGAAGYAMAGTGIVAVEAGTGGVGLLLGGVVVSGLASAANMTSVGKHIADYTRGHSNIGDLVVDVGLGLSSLVPEYGAVADVMSLSRDLAPGLYVGP